MTLSKLPDEECFRHLTQEETDELVELQVRFGEKYDQAEYEDIVHAMMRASAAILNNSISEVVLDIRKSSLAIKEEALISYLDQELPAWKQLMKRSFRFNILNILRLFFKKYPLDLSVFYLLDNVIDHPDIISAYHDFVNLHYLKSHSGNRFYHIFYNKPCMAISTDGVLKRKARTGTVNIENELKRMRSFSDFLRSRKRMRIVQASSNNNMFIITPEELNICVPPLESMLRGLDGVISADYRINVFLASYLGTLAAFIPTFQDFELAQKEGMFETDLRYCDFKKICTKSTLHVEDYDEYLYTFVVSANDYFYQYLNAFWRDLTNKLMFEPVSFYLTFMATVFSLLSLIQVLQNAKIIPTAY